MNEKKLIVNLRKGKPEAYQYLFSEYYEWLCNYIFKLCDDRQLAEDMVQETMMLLWKKRKKIWISSSLKNYLFKTCHNQFLQHLRKNKIKFDTLDKIKWEAIAEVSNEAEVYENRLEKLFKLIEQLPPHCKEVFIRSKLKKATYQDIAKEMNISKKTVENQMSKALHFLRENANSFLL